MISLVAVPRQKYALLTIAEFAKSGSLLSMFVSLGKTVSFTFVHSYAQQFSPVTLSIQTTISNYSYHNDLRGDLFWLNKLVNLYLGTHSE